MDRLSKEQRTYLKYYDYGSLYSRTCAYHDTDEVLFNDVYDYYVMTDNSVPIKRNNFYSYYKRYYLDKQFDDLPEMHEAYKGNNKIILYYLKKLK